MNERSILFSLSGLAKLRAVALAGLVVLLVSCRNDKNFSPTPRLEWVSGALANDDDTTSGRRKVAITLYFTDGDGNIGRPEGEPLENSCDPDEYDLLIRYYERVEGFYEEQLYDTTLVPVLDGNGNVIDTSLECLTFNVILPDLMPEGQNKNLEGEIKTDFDYSGFPNNLNADSIRFEFQLKDRDRNGSNIVVSPAIAIP